MKNGIRIGGVFKVDVYDKYGVWKWSSEGENIVTNVGLDHLLDVLLGGATAKDPWYVGLKNTGTPVAGDTLASHGSWTENSNYTGNRQAYVEAASSGQSVTNTASKASFSIDTDTQAITGAFLAGAATGTADVLLCVADFSLTKNVDNGDTLQVTYTVGAADDGA